MVLSFAVVACALTVISFLQRKLASQTGADISSATAPAYITGTITSRPLSGISMQVSKSNSIENTTTNTQLADCIPLPVATNLSLSVQTILELSRSKASYYQYRSAIRGLTRNLSTADVSALMSFLTQKAADHGEMRPIAFNAVKNDILDVLLRQDKLPPDIGRLIVEMYNDRTYDTMWRDYCVQFASNYYERRWIYTETSQNKTARDDVVDKSDYHAVEHIFKNALLETDSTIAGTALLGLVSLAANHETTVADIPGESFLAPDQIKKAVVHITAIPQCSEPTRITAIRLAASLGCDEVLPDIRIFAQTGATVTLRMAAIATLGDMGSQNDIELLQSLAADSEPRIRAIAAKALAKLTKG